MDGKHQARERERDLISKVKECLEKQDEDLERREGERDRTATHQT